MTGSAQVPPHNLDAEQAVLGAMLSNVNAVGVVEPRLRPEDFYREAHSRIYTAILDASSKHEPIDVVTVGDKLPDYRDMISTFADFVPSSSSAAHYANLVKKDAVRRAVIRAGQEIAALGYDDDVDPEDALDQAESHVFGARPESGGDGGSIYGMAADIIREVETGDAPPVLSTGFQSLDRQCSGLYEGNMVVLGARPGIGKTALAMNIAWNVAKEGTVLFFSLEMSSREVTERLLSCHANVPLRLLRERAITNPQHLSQLYEAMGEVEARPLLVFDDSSINMMGLKSQVRRMLPKQPKLIVVDYLQLLTLGRRAESRYVEVSAISRELKSLARLAKCPVLALSQLNRESQNPFGDNKVTISQLRESGAIEQDADQVWLMYHPERNDGNPPGTVVVDVQKNRHGPTGEVHLHWQPTYTRFGDT